MLLFTNIATLLMLAFAACYFAFRGRGSAGRNTVRQLVFPVVWLYLAVLTALMVRAGSDLWLVSLLRIPAIWLVPFCILSSAASAVVILELLEVVIPVIARWGERRYLLAVAGLWSGLAVVQSVFIILARARLHDLAAK